MKYKIMVVEDEVELAEIERDFLLAEQYDVLLCHDGNTAFGLFQQYQPDILLLDIMLPGTDGIEILRRVRTESTAIVIITSAKESEFDRILGLGLGADDYMTKPFSIKEMVARVKAQLRRSFYFNEKISITEHIIGFQNIKIDLKSRQIIKGEAEIFLTVKEYDILVFLLQHPNQVFTREQMFEHIWGTWEVGDLNTITVHVQKIREKLKDPESIVTVRGIGYRFNGAML